MDSTNPSNTMDSRVWSESAPCPHFSENGTTSESDSVFSVPSTPRSWGARYPVSMPVKPGTGYLTPPFLVSHPSMGVATKPWSRSMSAGTASRTDNVLIANVIAKLRAKGVDHRSVDVFDDDVCLPAENESAYSADISVASSRRHSRTRSITSRKPSLIRGLHPRPLANSVLPVDHKTNPFAFGEETAPEAQDGDHSGSCGDHAGGDLLDADAGSGQKRGRPRSGNLNSNSQERDNDPQSKRGRFIMDGEVEDKASKRWACPYQKFDPIGEPSCGHPKPNNLHGGFDNLSRLKTHLKECHDPVMRCRTCWLSFKSVSKGDQIRRMEQLALHIEQGNCAPRAPPRKYWMTEEQRLELNVTQYGSDVDRWYRFLKLLVPGMTPEEMRARYKPWYVPPSPQAQQAMCGPQAGAGPQRRPLTPESAGSEGDTSSTLLTPLPRALPMQTTVDTIAGQAEMSMGDPFLSSMAVDGLGMDMTGLSSDMASMFGFDGVMRDQDNTFVPNPMEARLQIDSFAGTTPALSTTVLRPRPGHLQPDVQMLRQKNRRLVDVVSRTRGDIAEVEELLSKVLRITDGDVKESVEKAVLLLSDVQCRLDDS